MSPDAARSSQPQDASSAIDISALVVNYNTTQLAFEMLQSLREQAPRAPDGRPLKVEFVFVDNASPELEAQGAALEQIRELAKLSDVPGTVVLHDENAGYAGGMNLAWSHARGQYALVLNPDLVFLEGCIERLYGELVASPEIGAVGPVGYWDRGREVQLPPNILPTLGDLWYCTFAHVFESVNRRYVARRLREALKVYRSDEPVRLDMLSGACVMLSRTTIERIGGLFDSAFPLYYEDTDLFRRVRKAGLELVMVKGADLAHFYNRSGTTNPEEAMRRYWTAREYYYTKYYGWLGKLSEKLCRRFLRSKLARRARERMTARVRDLGDVWEPPMLELGRDCEHFVLEMCQDAGFLLAAAILGKGSSWTPGESFWHAFGESEYFFRAVDLGPEEPVELAVFRFRRVPPPASGPAPNDAAVSGQKL